MNKKNIKNIKSKDSSGFTLVEILLYISIISILTLSFSIFLFMILQSRAKHQTISEVDQVGIQASQIISQAIRNAKRINLPAQGSQGTTLSLEMEDALKNPTILNSGGTNIQKKEGVNPITSLTSSRLNISNFSFYNVSKDDTSGVIKFQFTISYVNPSGRNEYDYSKIFYGSGALRYD